jgi:hypothetical protein
MFRRKGKILAASRLSGCRTAPSTRRNPPVVLSKSIRTGRWKLPRMECLWWHLPAPRSAVCACDSGPSAKAEVRGCFSPVSAMRFFPFCARNVLTFEVIADERAPRTLPGKATSRRTMPTHPSDPPPLCAAQARPARRSGHEATGPVRRPAASPVSPEGDHFPQALPARAYVRPKPEAPTPPHCHAWQRIRGGMGGL